MNSYLVARYFLKCSLDSFALSLLEHFNYVFTLLLVKDQFYLSEFIMQENCTSTGSDTTDITEKSQGLLALQIPPPTA
jgi:hypothetical protein